MRTEIEVTFTEPADDGTVVILLDGRQAKTEIVPTGDKFRWRTSKGCKFNAAGGGTFDTIEAAARPAVSYALDGRTSGWRLTEVNV